MKKVEAIVREEDLFKIITALEKEEFTPLTVTRVIGRGRQGGLKFTFEDKEVRVSLIPKAKIEIVVDDKDVDKVVKIIINNARRGVPGDGKIFIIPVEDAIRIRTGERGVKAL